MIFHAPTLRSIILVVRRFREEEKAVAAVEFALIVPFLITLYLGSLETAALFTVDKRINSISSTVGDLVAQWDPDDGQFAHDEFSHRLQQAPYNKRDRAEPGQQHAQREEP